MADLKRDQRGNGDPVTHVHGGAGLTGLMIFCLPLLYLLQWRSHTPIQKFYQLKQFSYLLSHLLVLWVAVAEQWRDLTVDTEERGWMKPKAHRPPGTCLKLDGAPDSPVGCQQQKLLMCTSFSAFLRHHRSEQSFVLAFQSDASVSKPAARETRYEPFFYNKAALLPSVLLIHR